MPATAEQVQALTTALKANFTKGLGGYEAQSPRIAEEITSTTAVNMYGWLSQGWPKVRQWIGPRQFGELKKEAYSLTNKPFESSFSVNRTDVEDDQLGAYANVAQGHGRAAAEFKDQAVFELLAKGKDNLCFDGQNFFDHEHPMKINGQDKLISNMIDGTEVAPWFLLDTRKPLKPLICQKRKDFEFVAQTKPDSDNVFLEGKYNFGIDGRFAFGYTFWQLALVSYQPLNEQTLRAARLKMRQITNERGAPMGINPNMLVVGLNNQDTAEDILTKDVIGGTTNSMKGKFELLASDWLQ